MFEPKVVPNRKAIVSIQFDNADFRILFLQEFNAPVGAAVPVGYYDRSGAGSAFGIPGWQGQPDGIVLRLLAPVHGFARRMRITPHSSAPPNAIADAR